MNEQISSYIIYTWGCQMNEDDSQQIRARLASMGMVATDNPELADVALLVTCSVREKPEQKALSKLGELRLIKEQRPEMIIGVCGCMAQRKGASLGKTRPFIDFMVGTHNISLIPDLIEQSRYRRKMLAALELPRERSDNLELPGRVTRTESGLKCFVPIMYGCDNFCSYCIVPYVRGRERNRPLPEIISEVSTLVSTGCKDVTLLGQNVNSYITEDMKFPGLLNAVSKVDGIERIRFMTSHPKDLSDELIQTMAENPKVCNHIHLAVQSGDDRILQEMNRGYSVQHIKNRISLLREAVPDIAITTDFLVGFPGETEQEFENTLNLAEELRFYAAFMFSFNAIPGTEAAGLADQLPAKLKNSRLNRLIDIQNRITLEINTAEIGKEFEVLVEGLSPKDKSRATGLTTHGKTANFACDTDLTGQTVKIRVTEGHLYGYFGELISEKVH